MRHLRSNSRCPAGKFSSTTNIKSLEWLVLDHHVGNRDGFSDGLGSDPAIPLARNFIPGQATLKLFENNPDHNARPRERWLASADFWISHNVAPKHDPRALPICFRFHAAVPTMRLVKIDCKAPIRSLRSH